MGVLYILGEIGSLAIVSPPPHEGRQMLFLRTSPSGDFTPELNMTSATFLWELNVCAYPRDCRLKAQKIAIINPACGLAGQSLRCY